MENYTETRIQNAALLPAHSGVCWNAIFGGWLVAAAIAIFMYTLGSAIGISALDLGNANALSVKVAAASVIWVLLTWFVALYTGGFFAGSSIPDYYCGKKHGFAVWALSLVLTVLFGMAGVGAAFSGALATAQAAGGAAAAAGPLFAKAASSAAEEYQNAPAGFQADIKNAISEIAGTRADNTPAEGSGIEIDGKVFGKFASALIYGDEEEAKNILAVNTNLSREEIDRAAEKVAQKKEELKAKAKEAAEKVSTYTQAMLWSAFFISFR